MYSCGRIVMMVVRKQNMIKGGKCWLIQLIEYDFKFLLQNPDQLALKRRPCAKHSSTN
jgi:hypothetical protein